MANFTPSKKQASDFNNGIEYVNKVDTPNAEDFNNVIESQLYTQDIVENFKKSSNYSASTTYQYPTIVNYQGSGYICTSETAISGILPTDTAKWTKIVDKGEAGSGAPVVNIYDNSTEKVYSTAQTNIAINSLSMVPSLNKISNIFTLNKTTPNTNLVGTPYTAPANGYVALWVTLTSGTNNFYGNLFSKTTTPTALSSVFYRGAWSSDYYAWLPVKKGDNINIWYYYSGAIENYTATFYYSEELS